MFQIRREAHPNIPGLARVVDARTFRLLGSVEKAPGAGEHVKPEWVASSLALGDLWVGGSSRRNAQRFLTRQEAARAVWQTHQGDRAAS